MSRILTFIALASALALAGCETPSQSTPSSGGTAEARAVLGCEVLPIVVGGGGDPGQSPVQGTGYRFFLLNMDVQGSTEVWSFGTVPDDGDEAELRTQAIGSVRAVFRDQTVIGNWHHRDTASPRVSLVSVFGDGRVLISFLTGSFGHVTHPGRCQELG